MQEKYIVNRLKKGDFVLEIRADRKLTKEEMFECAARYLRATKQKSLPAAGRAVMYAVPPEY